MTSTTLVLGGTGRVGSATIKELLRRKMRVRALVRNAAKLHDLLQDVPAASSHPDVVVGNVDQYTVDDFVKLLSNDVTGVVIALGHQITMRGILWEPHFVSKATQSVFQAINNVVPVASASPIRVAILSTPGIIDKRDPHGYGTHAMLRALQGMTVPLADSQAQAEVFLAQPLTERVEWCAVRPYTFVERGRCEYVMAESVREDGVFNGEHTSIANIGHFMSELVTDQQVWNAWKGKAVLMKNKNKTDG